MIIFNSLPVLKCLEGIGLEKSGIHGVAPSEQLGFPDGFYLGQTGEKVNSITQVPV
jgi:hypothetical protein